MTINELIMNIGDRYNMPKEPENAKKANDIYRKDFGFYSPSKLEKVWYAIKRYHGTNFAPNFSAIAHCMDKAGLGESKDTGADNFYQRCDTCNAKYSMGVSCCPKCNKYLPIDEGVPQIFTNSVTIIKCQTLPQDLIVLRQACPICPLFRASSIYPRGIKCDCYQTDRKGSLPNCDNCKCRECCYDLGSKNEDMPDGVLLKVVMSKIVKRVGKRGDDKKVDTMHRNGSKIVSE